MTATFSVLGTPAVGPKNLCFDPAGRYIYYACSTAGRISQFDTSTSTFTLTRFGTGTAGSTNGAAGTGQTNYPQVIATDGTWVYWVEFATNTKVRRANITSGAIEDFVGTATAGTADGIGAAATLQNVKGMCINGARTKLYFSQDFTIRVVDIASATVTTLPIVMLQNSSAICIDPTDTYLYGTNNTTKIWRAALPNPAIFTYIAANGTITADVDGLGRTSQMRDVTQFANDGTRMLISENTGSVLRQLTLDPQGSVPNMTTLVDSNTTPLTFTGVTGVTAWPGQANTFVGSDSTGSRLLKVILS